MATRTLDRLLLIPALLVLGSLTLAGCSLLPGANTNSSNSSSSDKDDTKDDDKDEAEDEEAEQEEQDDAASGCPESVVQSMSASAAAGSAVEVISASEYSVPAIGLDLLEAGCLFRVVVGEGETSTKTDFGYLPGNADTVIAIGASLEAAGYEKVMDGMYQSSETSGVFVFQNDGSMDSASIEELGFGDDFVVVMASSSAS